MTSADFVSDPHAPARTEINVLLGATTPIQSVEELAQQLGLNRRSLLRHFREAGQPSPLGWINAVRLVRTIPDLHMKYATVARRHGYADPFTYSNAFHRVLGKRPRACWGRDPEVVLREWHARHCGAAQAVDPR